MTIMQRLIKLDKALFSPYDDVADKTLVCSAFLIVGLPLLFLLLTLMIVVWQIGVATILTVGIIYGLVRLFRRIENES